MLYYVAMNVADPIREKKYIKARLEGKTKIDSAIIATGNKNRKTANITAHRLEKRKSVQQQLSQALRLNGITIKKAIKPIADALEAWQWGKEKVETITEDGETITNWIDIKIPNHPTRLKASSMSLDLLGIDKQPNQSAGYNELNDKSISKALETSDEIELHKVVFGKTSDDSVTVKKNK